MYFLVLFMLMIQEPKEITVGFHWKARGTGLRRKKKKVKDTFMYVPVLQTLQGLLADEHVIQQVCLKFLM